MKRKSLKPSAPPSDQSSDDEAGASDQSDEGRMDTAEQHIDTEETELTVSAKDDGDDAPNDTEPAEPEKRASKRKHGIIYLSTIPKHMTVAIARDMFGQHAAIGRMFFQPNEKNDDSEAAARKKQKKSKKFQPRHFAEGWVEFLSKRAAKAVAQRLNGQPIALRKSSKFADTLWTMKYLPRFKWVHLSERLTYEKAVHKQRLQAEVSQARREAQFFQENLDRSDKNKRLSKKKAKVAATVAATANRTK